MNLHHIAYVCKNVNEKAKSLCEQFGFKIISEPVVDEYQGVKILFIQSEDGTKIELLEPYGQNSPVKKYLDKGGGLYHFCFEVENLEKTLETITSNNKAFVVRPPMKAPAIENKKAAFIVTAEKDIIEFVEK
jgi:methylmalonyl-CoA/ethylmalonyl-CoA epimerase